MLASEAELVLASHTDLPTSRGTTHLVRHFPETQLVRRLEDHAFGDFRSHNSLLSKIVLEPPMEEN
jgi:hypothetical protein